MKYVLGIFYYKTLYSVESCNKTKSSEKHLLNYSDMSERAREGARERERMSRRVEIIVIVLCVYVCRLIIFR